jgi:hypothetical protein
MVTLRHLTEPVRGPGHFPKLISGDSTMNSTMSGRRSFLRATIAATGFALVAASTLAPTVAAAHNGAGSKALVGTWRVTVTTFPCANPQAKNPAFVSLLTFGNDGSLIETTSSPQFQPGQRSIGHGFWERTGPGAYRVISEAFIQFATTPPPPAPALQTGRQRLDQGIQMTSRDSFVSDATVAFFAATAPDGVAPYFTGCAKAIGVRFE